MPVTTSLMRPTFVFNGPGSTIADVPSNAIGQDGVSTNLTLGSNASGLICFGGFNFDFPPNIVIKSINAVIVGQQATTPTISTFYAIIGDSTGFDAIDAIGGARQENQFLMNGFPVSATTSMLTGVDVQPFGGKDREWQVSDLLNPKFAFALRFYSSSTQGGWTGTLDDVQFSVTYDFLPNANTGWLSGTKAEQLSVFGTTPVWNDPLNALTADGQFATQAIPANSFTAPFLFVSGFLNNGTLPNDAIITGYEVLANGRQTAGSGALQVQVYNSGGFNSGNNRSLGWNTTQKTTTLGGDSDTWSIGSITPSEAKASAFGVIVLSNSTTTAYTAQVDQVQVKIHYYSPSVKTVTAYPILTSNEHVDFSNGVNQWENWGFAAVSDNQYAYQQPGLNGYTDFALEAFGYPFNIPQNATVLDVQLGIEKYRGGGSSGDIVDDIVQVGIFDLAASGPTWGTNNASASSWPTTEQTTYYNGGLWGLDLTPDIVNFNGDIENVSPTEKLLAARVKVKNQGSTYLETYAGPKSGSITSEPAASGRTWATPNNALTSNNIRTTVVAPGADATNPGLYPFLNVSGFNFTFAGAPANAQPVGIEAVEISIDAAIVNSGAGGIIFDTVQLYSGGQRVGVPKSNATALTTSEAYRTFGNVTNDTWGLTSQELFNMLFMPGADLGVSIRVRGTTATTTRTTQIDYVRARILLRLSGDRLAYVDSMPMTVTYLEQSGERVSVDKLSFAQTLRTPNTVETVRVAVDKLSFVESLYEPNANQTEKSFVDKLSFVESLYEPEARAATLLEVDKLSFSQNLFEPNTNAKVKLPVDKLGFVQTLREPNVNDVLRLPIDKLTQVQTPRAPTTNSREKVLVDKLSEIQSLFAPTVNAKEKLPVDKLGFTQVLREPTANQNEKAFVNKLEFNQVLRDVNLNAKEAVVVDKLSFNQTLRAPLVKGNEALDVDKLEFSQVLRDVNVNAKTKISVDQLVQVQSLHAPNLNAKTKVSVDYMQFSQVLRAPNLNAIDIVRIDKLSLTQNLFDPLANGADLVVADRLLFSQNMLEPTVNAKEKVVVDRLAQVLALFAPKTNVAVRVDKLNQAQTLRDPRVQDRVRVDALVEVQTLFAPNTNNQTNIAVDKLSFIQSFKRAKVDTVIYVETLGFSQNFGEVFFTDRVVVDKLEQTVEFWPVMVPNTVKVNTLVFTQRVYTPRITIDVVPQFKTKVTWVKWDWNEEGTMVMPVVQSSSGTIFLSKRIKSAMIPKVPLIKGATIGLAMPVDVEEDPA